MTTELDLQADLCKAIRALGGFAMKLSNRFTVGVQDLLVKLPEYPTALLEIKMIDALPRRGDDLIKLRHPLTPLQRETIKKYRAAGGPTGVMTVYQERVKGRAPQDHAIYTPLAPEMTKDEFDIYSITRRHGVKWQSVIEQVLDPMWRK